MYLGTFGKERGTTPSVVNVYGLLPSQVPGNLFGIGDSSSASADLTAEGTADWIHWGDAALQRKAGGGAQISNYSVIGGMGVGAYGNDLRRLSWTDGTPTPSSVDNTNGLFVYSVGNGFTFTAPADTTPRTLTVHVGGFNSGATLQACLTDGSALPFTDVAPADSGQYDRNYTLSYRASAPGQALRVTWTMTSGGVGNVTLNGAALSVSTGDVTATAGTPQSTAVNTAFGTALQATVRDAGGNPVSGVTVTFTAPGSGSSARFSGLTTATAVTDSQRHCDRAGADGQRDTRELYGDGGGTGHSRIGQLQPEQHGRRCSECDGDGGDTAKHGDQHCVWDSVAGDGAGCG